MGWHRSIGRHIASLALAGIATLSLSANVKAQDATNYTSFAGPYLTLHVGRTAAVAGSIAITANSSNAALLLPGEVRPANNAPDVGSRIYIRVDGGSSSAQGLDYIFGDLQTAANGTTGGNGVWVQVPTVINNQLVARWRTLPTTKTIATGGGGGGVGGGGGGGGTTTVSIDHRIEVEMIASFVHDTVRFQFNVINTNNGTPRTVGIGFVQNIEATPNVVGVDGPVRLPNYPYLRRDTVLSGGLVPRYWETFYQTTAATDTNPAVYHSIRGTLRPVGNLANEPTPPTRFQFGDIRELNGHNLPTLQKDFDQIWNFQPSTTFNATAATAEGDAGVALFWTEQSVVAGQTQTITTFLGRATTDNDFAPPLALSVEAPQALNFATNRTNNTTTVTPNPFTITAYVTNLTNVLTPGGLNIAPVNLAIDLPSGLRLDTGETITKQIASISSGTEGSVQWRVVPTGTVTGTVNYTVTASGNLGTGKSVQRSIEIPAPNVINLKGNDTTLGLFQMLSFPLAFGNTAPSTVLGLNSNPPDFDMVRYNPTTGRYEPANTLVPGQAYWFRLRLANDLTKTLAPNIGSPLENQVQPNASTYRINYPRGWNQVANPYLYGIRLSEVQVFDTETLRILYVSEAADSVNRWILPAVYRYNTTSSDPALWSYELLDNLGFVMRPYEGYWMLVLKNGLQFIYPGADTPGVSVTRSALVGVGLGATLGRGTSNNWRLRIAAKSKTGSDTTNYIGVAPKATDGDDVYKYAKPPIMDGQLTLDIVRQGGEITRLAQDLRAPGGAAKTWDFLVRSPKANEEVTITWPEVAAVVPRDYQLTLVDKDSNVRRVLRNTSSYTLNTGASATRAFQIVAEPMRRAGRVQITNFDVQPGRTRGANGETSVAINYGFSQNAEARINIRNGRGQTIRTLIPTTRSAEGGSTVGGNVVWDLRDQSGSVLPGGVYQMELLAIGSDGQTSRQVRPYVLSR
jgi:hypothetical protein